MARNKGHDYHLRALGIESRGDWEVLDLDSRNFDNGVIVCRPDFLLRHIPSSVILVLDYKSRDLAEGVATQYEQYQVVIAALVIRDLLGDQFHAMEVQAGLTYGDGERCFVEWDASTENTIRYTALEAVAEDGGRISGTELAALLSGADFSGVPQAVRERGTAAHQTLVQIGPLH